MAIQIKISPPVIEGEQPGFEVTLGSRSWYVERSDAQSLVDQFAELDVLPTKASQAIQSMNTQLQALRASELVFLRGLITSLIMKENKQ